MKTNKQMNTFLLLGAALVIGLVAMGASNEVQNADAKLVDDSAKLAAPMDELLLQELQKTNYILLKMAELDMEHQKINSDLLEEIKKLNKIQTESQKGANELSRTIAELSKSVNSATKNIGSGNNILSVNELLEDIKRSLNSIYHAINNNR